MHNKLTPLTGVPGEPLGPSFRLTPITWHLCSPLLFKIILTIVILSFRLPAPRRHPQRFATPWITTVTHHRTPSPPPLPLVTTRPPGWSPASVALPQSTSATSTVTHRTVTVCRTVGPASRRTSLPLNMHLTTTPQTIHTSVLWRRTTLGGIIQWALKCATMFYEDTFSSINLCPACKNDPSLVLSEALCLMVCFAFQFVCCGWLLLGEHNECWMDGNPNIFVYCLIPRFIFICITCCYIK